jgi:hypothetical protein
MAFSTINKSSSFMNTKLYTGTGSSNAITGVGFQPDMTWIKERDATGDHFVCDAIRGVTKYIIPNSYIAGGTNANTLTAFGADGFTVGSDGWTNNNTDTYASWNWKANGAGSANTDGSISSTVSVNTTSGFSIVKYTGTATIGTIGHGLGVAPKMVIVKVYDQAYSWYVHHASMGATKVMNLESTATESTSSTYNDTAPTSSVFSVYAGSQTNNSGSNFIAYCFADVAGYSKFSSYVGNGNTSSPVDGTFVYTGFKPSWLLVKRSDSTGAWMLIDNKRLGYNDDNRDFKINDNIAERDVDQADILSNGFKVRTTSSDWNTSGGTYIYMAFGQPIISNSGVCATAR